MDAAPPHYQVSYVQVLPVGAGNALIDHSPGTEGCDAQGGGGGTPNGADLRPAHHQIQGSATAPPEAKAACHRLLPRFQPRNQPVGLHIHGPLNEDGSLHVRPASHLPYSRQASQPQNRPTAQPASTSVGKCTPTYRREKAISAA